MFNFIDDVEGLRGGVRDVFPGAESRVSGNSRTLDLGAAISAVCAPCALELFGAGISSGFRGNDCERDVDPVAK